MTTHIDEVRGRLAEAMRATPPSQLAYDLLWALNRGDALEQERDRLRQEAIAAQRLAAQWRTAAAVPTQGAQWLLDQLEAEMLRLEAEVALLRRRATEASAAAQEPLAKATK